MNRLFEFLYTILPGLHILAAIAAVTKMIIVFKNKGFSLPAYVISFFRVYSSNEKHMTNNVSRQQYMRINNFINYYLYAWLLITLIIFLVFHEVF
jgi:hypothetical protein